MASANAAAGRLLGLVVLTGDLRLEEALDLIADSSLGQRLRVIAADALGELAGSVLLAGETEVQAGGLRLRLAPEHLQGILESPVGA